MKFLYSYSTRSGTANKIWAWSDLNINDLASIHPAISDQLEKIQINNNNTVLQKMKKTSQELRMLSRSPSDCRSLLLNLNLNLNRCLCSDCSDCSAIVVLL